MQDDDTENLVEMLAGHVNGVIRALLVAGRRGAPAEGRIPFNPLYFNILRTLGAAGPCRPSFIAAHLSVPRTTISTAIKSAALRSLIEATPDKDDGRAMSLSLSSEGREVLDAILRQDLRNSAAMLEALAPDEREDFVRALEKVVKGISS